MVERLYHRLIGEKMRQRIFLIFLIAACLLPSRAAEACVGRIIHIGAANSPAERVLSEIIALLIAERTGTTVKTMTFDTHTALYDAIRAGEIGIFTENTTRALEVLGSPGTENTQDTYDLAKQLYREKLNLVWLDVLGLTVDKTPNNQAKNAIVISNEILSAFPGIPRLLNKLAQKISEDDYIGLVQTANSGDDPKTIARTFLNSKKLI